MSGPNKSPMYPLRAPAAELAAWKDAAEEADETLAEWLREAARLRLESKAGARESFVALLAVAAKETERMRKRLGEANGGAAVYWDGWTQGRRALIEELLAVRPSAGRASKKRKDG